MWRKVNTVHYIQRQIHVTIEYPECSLETSLGVHFINVNCAFIHLEKQKKNQVRGMARKCMKPGKSSGIRRDSEIVDPEKLLPNSNPRCDVSGAAVQQLSAGALCRP